MYNQMELIMNPPFQLAFDKIISENITRYESFELQRAAFISCSKSTNAKIFQTNQTKLFNLFDYI